MKKVKITVLKTAFYEDLAREYGVEGLAPCSIMKEGQVFYADRTKPDGFCDGAWRSIYQYVFALANGGGKEGFFYNDWAKEPGVAIRFKEYTDPFTGEKNKQAKINSRT